VRTGQGDPVKALAGLYIWPWQTEEVLDLVRWMRQWNAAPGHRQVRFYGFDMQAGGVSAQRLAARLQQIDPALAAEVGPALARLAAVEAVPTTPAEEYHAAVSAVAAALPRIAARLPEPASAADRQGIVDRHYVQLLQQNTRYRGDSADAREQGMADNVRWIADVAEPGARVVVWAHNAHVSTFGGPYPAMGHYLATALGKDYLPVGFVFHHGSFQAMIRNPRGRELAELTVGPPPAGTLEDTFERAGWPLCLLDLRRLPASGAVAEWFRSPQQMRSIGSLFSGELNMMAELVPTDEFAALIYVEATTRARPNPGVQP
jgi:erythromycin esterase